MRRASPVDRLMADAMNRVVGPKLALEILDFFWGGGGFLAKALLPFPHAKALLVINREGAMNKS